MEIQKDEPVESKRCEKCGNHHESMCATNVTNFYWAHGAKNSVVLVGEWSQWQNLEEMNLVKGVYYHAENLSVGFYRYKFKVDDEWRYDPTSPTEQDPYGSYNNVVDVVPRTVYLPSTDLEEDSTGRENIVKLSTQLLGNDVRITGSWDNWKTERKMARKHNPLKNCDQSFIELELESGKAYEYKFKINGDYVVDQAAPTIRNCFGSLNNRLIVSERTHCESPRAHSKGPSSQAAKQIQPKQWSWKRVSVQSFRDCIFGHSICSVGEQIYIFGGKRKRAFTNELIRLNAKNLQNVQIEKVSIEPRAFHTALSYGNKLIIYGGCSQSDILSDYHVFVTQTNQWIDSRKIKGIPSHKREKGSCVLFRELLVFFGGYFCSPDIEMETFFNDLEVLDIENMAWAPSPQIEGHKPCPRFSHSANLYGTHMIVFGGEYRTDKNVDDVWQINLDRKGNALKWQQFQPKGPPPRPRHGHSANIIQHYMIIFGGMGDQGQAYNDIIILDLKTIQWIQPNITGDIPRARHYHAATTVDKQLIMFGGKTMTHKNENIYVLKPHQVPQQVPTFDLDIQQ